MNFYSGQNECKCSFDISRFGFWDIERGPNNGDAKQQSEWTHTRTPTNTHYETCIACICFHCLGLYDYYSNKVNEWWIEMLHWMASVALHNHSNILYSLLLVFGDRIEFNNGNEQTKISNGLHLCRLLPHAWMSMEHNTSVFWISINTIVLLYT